MQYSICLYGLVCIGLTMSKNKHTMNKYIYMYFYIEQNILALFNAGHCQSFYIHVYAKTIFLVKLGYV